MKVKRLKEILNKALENCENYSDEDEVNIHCNSYRVGLPMLATFDGFVDLNNIVDEDDWNEDDDE